MRIVKEKTLSNYCQLNKFKGAEKSLRAWVYEVRFSSWKTAHELKMKYGSASILGSKRVVFNIRGNDYRLIVDIEYNLQLVFVVWFGTHEEYNLIDVKKIKYES